MGKSSPPPAPDYSGLILANQQASQQSFQLGQEQLAWAKEVYGDNKDTIDAISNLTLKQQEQQFNDARQDRARYEDTFLPLQNKYIRQAEDFMSPERIQQEAGRAGASVNQEFQAARDNARSQLEAFGVDPSQTRAGALDLQSRVAQGAARAAAMNNARQQTFAQGQQMLGGAVNMGNGLPAQATSGFAGSANAGFGTGQLGNQAFQTGSQAMGTPTQWQAGGFTGLNQAADAQTASYRNQLGATQLEQSATSGLGSILGLGLGMARGYATGGMSGIFNFEEGGAVPSPEEFEGIHIDEALSPSGGVRVDDVPATLTPDGSGPAIRLNAGEFVVPEDTVRWFGEQHFQKLIEKGKEEKHRAKAKPEIGAINVGG